MNRSKGTQNALETPLKVEDVGTVDKGNPFATANGGADVKEF